jgi:hypothetical protein
LWSEPPGWAATGTACKKWTISAPLSTTGTFFDSLALMMRSNAAGRRSVTPKEKRSAQET